MQGGATTGRGGSREGRAERSVVLSRLLALVTWALVAAGVLRGVLAAFYSTTTSAACFAGNSCDGLTFRAVAALTWAGADPYSREERTAWVSRALLGGEEPAFDLPFQYPPTSLPLLLPRAFGPADLSAAVVVGVGTLASLIVLAVMLERHPWRAMWVGLAALWPITLMDAALAQTGALASVCAFGVIAGVGRSPARAGVALGLLVFKPHYAVPLAIVLLVNLRFAELRVAALTASVLAALGTLLVGVRGWGGWLASLAQENHTTSLMVSWLGVASRAGIDTSGLPLAAYGLALLGIFGLSVYARRAGWPVSTVLVGIFPGLLLASPNTHPYDLNLVVPALLWLVPVRPVPQMAVGLSAYWIAASTSRTSITLSLLVLAGVWAWALLRGRAVGSADPDWVSMPCGIVERKSART